MARDLTVRPPGLCFGAGITVFAAMALAAKAFGHADLIGALAAIGNALVGLSRFGLAALILAAARALRGRTHRSFQTWVYIVTALLLASAFLPLLLDHGPAQFGGAIDVFGSAPALIWVVWLSATIAREPIG